MGTLQALLCHPQACLLTFLTIPSLVARIPAFTAFSQVGSERADTSSQIYSGKVNALHQVTPGKANASSQAVSEKSGGVLNLAFVAQPGVQSLSVGVMHHSLEP